MSSEARCLFVDAALQSAELIKIIVRRGVRLFGYGAVQGEAIIAADRIEIRSGRILLGADSGGVLRWAAPENCSSADTKKRERERFYQAAALVKDVLRHTVTFGNCTYA
jgi:hypothetical protein